MRPFLTFQQDNEFVSYNVNIIFNCPVFLLLNIKFKIRNDIYILLCVCLLIYFIAFTLIM